MTIKLVGVTRKGQSYDLELKDCPVRLNDKFTILQNRENSPMLITESIGRAVEGTDICELDRVYLKGSLIGYFIYTDGFYVWNHITDELTPLAEVEYDRVERNLECEYPEGIQKKRSYIRWKSGESSYGIHELLMVLEDRLFICVNQIKPLYVSNSRMWTGLTINNEPVYFGDVTEKGIITFDDYRPRVVTHDDNIIDLEV